MIKIKRQLSKWGLLAVKAGIATVAVVGVEAAIAGTLTHVPSANTKTPGISSPNILSSELQEVTVAQGSTPPLENPSATTRIYYEYSVDGNMLPAPGDIPSAE